KCVQRASQFIEVTDPTCIERRNLQPASGCVLDQTVLLQEPECLQNGGARYGELLRDFLLNDARSRSERALANGVKQHSVDLVYIVWSRLQFQEFCWHDDERCEYRILSAYQHCQARWVVWNQRGQF